jgi:antitoxin ParD1/3/4
MNISLTPALEQFVQDNVQTGRYNSASDVICEALRLLQEREQIRYVRLKALRKKIADGLEQLDRGEGIDAETAVQDFRILSNERRRPKTS